ncbi:MAG: AAA family ATPase [Rubrivivax sp.]|nr:AAA family ATPase [Rubrivivax sp.]
MDSGDEVAHDGAPRLHLCGPPHVEPAGRAPLPLEWHDAALLAVLAIRGPIERQEAAAWLWPDVTPSTARGNLRQRLLRLRRTVGPDLIEGQQTLKLAPGVRLDLGTAEDVPAEGDLLGSLDYADAGELGDWVEDSRRRWTAERRRRLALLADALESQHRHADALALAERLVREAPEADDAWLRLIRLHYLLGDTAAARRAGDACRAARAGAGCEPSAALRDLLSLAERGDPALARAAISVAVRRPPRMVGREATWAAVQEALALGRVPLLVGEPGIGKSRFLAEWVAAQPGAHLHATSIGDDRLPYATLGALLQPLHARHPLPADDGRWRPLAEFVDGLGDAPAACTAAQRTQALAQALAHWHGQGLTALVIDDLQWADDDSARALLALAVREDVPVRWVLAARRGEARPALAGWLAEAAERHVARLSMHALDPTQVEDLIASIAPQARQAPAWARALAAQGLGNPMHMLALLAHQLRLHGEGVLDAPVDGPLAVPATLTQVLDQAIGKLTPEARQLAQLAALARGHFDAPLALDVLDLKPLQLNDAWRELEREAVLLDGAVAHDTLHERLQASIAAPLSRLTHLRIAEVAPRHRVGTAAQAHHWRAAARPARAAEMYEQAAAEARARHAHEQEVAHLDAAAECHDAAGDRIAARAVRIQAADAALAIGGGGLRERIDAIASTAADDHERLQATLLVVRQRLTSHDIPGAQEPAITAVRLAEDLVARGELAEADGARLRASMLLGAARAQGGAHAAALDELQRLTPLIDRSPDLRLRMDCASTLGYSLGIVGRTAESVRAFERALDAATALDDHAEAHVIAHNLAGLYTRQGRYRAALELVMRARTWSAAMAAQMGAPTALALLTKGQLCTRLGRLDEALDALEGAVAELHGAGHASLRVRAQTSLARAWLSLGQPGKARQALGAWPAGVRGGRLAHELCRLAIDRRLRRPIGPELIELRRLDDPTQGATRQALELAIAREVGGAEGAAIAGSIETSAQAEGTETIVLQARLVAVAALLDEERTADALPTARCALADLDAGRLPMDIDYSEACWILYRAFDAIGDGATTVRLLLQGAGWVRESAARHVPEALRRGFMHGHPVNAELLRLEAARGSTR